MQGMSLNDKVKMTKRRIQEWVDEYGEDGVYVSFSGGKDSTVLLTIARQMYPNMKACFVNTGLEYPEIVKFIKTFDNVDIIRPKMNFKKVIEKYGYPFFGKEISETIYGARKYLTAYEKRGTALTDRQTDRQTDRPEVCTQRKVYGEANGSVCDRGSERRSNIKSGKDDAVSSDGEYP